LSCEALATVTISVKQKMFCATLWTITLPVVIGGLALAVGGFFPLYGVGALHSG